MKDYLKFIKSDKKTSSDLDLRIRENISDLQRKDLISLHLKIIFLYTITGFISLAICPQFGLNPFNRSPELIHMFMQYGTWACGLFCGSLFMGIGALIKFMVLGRKDILLLSRVSTLNITIVSALIYGLFMMIGNRNASSFINFSIVFFSFWLLGSIIWDRISWLILSQYTLRSNSGN